MKKNEYTITSLYNMKHFATVLAKYFCRKSVVIFLDGDLGAGKTTFTQFFGKALKINSIISSPTFNIMKRYQIDDNKYLNHFDLYRIKDNVYDQGFEEYWFSNDINIVEWSIYLPEEFQDMAALRISICLDNENRVLSISGEDDIIDYIKGHDYEFIY